MTILATNLNNIISNFCIVILFSTVLCVSAQETETKNIIKEAIRQQNLGLAFLEESQLSKAIPVFTELINDGDIDIFSTRSLALFKNNDGEFVPDLHYQEIIQQLSFNPYAAYFADLNKDGKHDILLHSTTGITLLKTAAGGSWDATPIIQHETYGPIKNFLLPIDYDHDGDLDICIHHVGIKMYRNNGDGTFTDVSTQTFIPTDADNRKTGRKGVRRCTRSEF